MVGDNAIYRSILESRPKCLPILSIPNWWIHQYTLTQSFNVILIEGQVLRTYLGCYQVAFVFLQPVCFLLACQMDDVETMIVILG